MNTLVSRRKSGIAFLASAILGLMAGLSAEASAEEPCFELDACSQDLLCKNVSDQWVKISPAGKKLHRSGPVTQVSCIRLVFSGQNCTGTYWRDDYFGNSCGVDYIPPIGRAESGCCGE